MQFIDNDTVEAAAKRPPISHIRQPLIMGVDVARFGEDQATVYFRRGLDARTIEPEKFRGLDLVTLSGKVAELAMLHGAAAVFIDETGMGSGVVDMVRKMLPNILVVGINNNGVADRYLMGSDMPSSANKGAEMWVSMRAWLKSGAIPDDPELKAELTGRQYGYNPKTEILLEKKDDMKKRGLSSPDNADGLALTFAYPVADTPDWVTMDAPGRPAATAQSDYDPHADL